MSVDAYTEFIKYNYYDAARELGSEATPQDIVEYLLRAWKRLGPNEKVQYEQYRKSRLTPAYGGRNNGNSEDEGDDEAEEEDDEAEEKEEIEELETSGFRVGRRPRPPSPWAMFVKENFGPWAAKNLKQRRTMGGLLRYPPDAIRQFGDWAGPIWKNLSPSQRKYYVDLAAKETMKYGPIKPTPFSIWLVLKREWFPAWKAGQTRQGQIEQPINYNQFEQYVRQRWKHLSREERDYYRDLARRDIEAAMWG